MQGHVKYSITITRVMRKYFLEGLYLLKVENANILVIELDIKILAHLQAATNY